MQTNVQISDFSKSYDKKTACSKINFAADKGRITCILGPNGAGKSTLLKAISGIIYEDSGKIISCGTDDKTLIRKNTGYVPETPELNTSVRAGEYILENAELYGIKREDKMKMLRNAADICALENSLDTKIKNMSKGYRQRVSLACALCHESAVLVLDEFSGGLDPKQQNVLKCELKRISESKTVIVSTHNISEAEDLCGESGIVYIMSNGFIKTSGTVKEILSSTGKSTLEEAYIFLTEEK